MTPTLVDLKPFTKANMAAINAREKHDTWLSVKEIASNTGISDGTQQAYNVYTMSH